jgi:hypothetical protein
MRLFFAHRRIMGSTEQQVFPERLETACSLLWARFSGFETCGNHFICVVKHGILRVTPVNDRGVQHRIILHSAQMTLFRCVSTAYG